MRGLKAGRRVPAVACLVGSCVVTFSSGPLVAGERVSAQDWPRVYIGDAFTAGAVRWALSGAAQRLAKPSCRDVLSTFKDEGGQPLERKLDALGLDGAVYLGVIQFRDGSREDQCLRYDRVAFTTEGGNIVWVCGRRFERAWVNDRRFAEVVIIHEALHTLGLGENPPSSQAITARVSASCSR